jgi:hypothetical protein
VIGNTIREKIKTLQWFLVWRKRARDLENINNIRTESKRKEVEYIRKHEPEKEYKALKIEADIMEIESSAQDAYEAYRLNEEEIKILEKLIKEAFIIAEPTRLIHEDWTPYLDEEMFEANAANEFTASIGKEIYAEILANGRPSPAKLVNAMSNPMTWNTLKSLWFIPNESKMLEYNDKKNELLFIENK